MDRIYAVRDREQVVLEWAEVEHRVGRGHACVVESAEKRGVRGEDVEGTPCAIAASSLVGRHPRRICSATVVARGTTGASSATTCTTRANGPGTASRIVWAALFATLAIAGATVHSPSVTSTIILALAVFGASSVEMVEAFTIVLAAGVSRGWKSAIEGTLAAVAVLAVIVVAVGVPLIHLVPLNTLRVVVGGLLLVLGLNWLRKAILRSSGHKALHDEDAIYAKTVAELAAEAAGEGGTSWSERPRDATGS